MMAEEEKLRRLRQLFNNLIFESDDTGGIFTLVTNFSSKRLSKRNKVKDVAELYSLYCSMAQDVKTLSEENKNLMCQIKSLENVIKEYIGPVNIAVAEIINKPKQPDFMPTTLSYTIEQVLESMLSQRQASNSESYQKENAKQLSNCFRKPDFL